jgi:hypothetical protein
LLTQGALLALAGEGRITELGGIEGRAGLDHGVEGGPGSPFGRYLRTVAADTWIPSFAISARIRGLPQVGLACHIRRINSIKSRSIIARPV